MNLTLKGTFLRLDEKAGTSKKTGNAYSISQVRVLVDSNVVVLPVDTSVAGLIDSLRAIKVQSSVSLDVRLGSKGQYFDPILTVVAVGK